MKKDKTVYVHQRDKIKLKLSIREKIEWTDKQKEFFDIALSKDMRIMLVKGPAGTSKTLAAVCASLKLLNDNKISDIIYTRSAVESSDAKLGYLPGDTNDKLHFYNLPFLEKLDELLTKEDIKTLEADKRISMFPINFTRGMSWNGKCIIFDEAQNSSRKEIITITTRLGKFNRLFVLADPRQTDLPASKAGAFEEIFDLFNKNKEESQKFGIYTFEFTKEDIVRSELVKFLIDMYDKLKPLTNGNGHS